MNKAGSILLLGSALATAALAPTVMAAPREVIDKPDWVRKPTGDDMERFYPAKARAERTGGEVRLVCDVTIAGALKDCVTVNESPTGYGFAEAALSLAPMFLMSPKRVGGEPVAGGSVTIPVIFKSPSDSAEFGDLALVVTRVGTAPRHVAPPTPEALEPLAIPCPDRVGQCEGHMFTWSERPNPEQTARMIAAAKPAEGASVATCTITTEGRLDGCQFNGVLAPRTVAVMREVMGLLRAPYKTADGLETSLATVVIGCRGKSWLATGPSPGVTTTGRP